MDETPYLILHKVRGLPAFDIAIQMEVPELGETWWIVPTSGHRAYPAASWDLHDLCDISDYPHEHPWTKDGLVTDDLPDHYPASERQEAYTTTLSDQMQQLVQKLAKPVKIERRI